MNKRTIKIFIAALISVVLAGILFGFMFYQVIERGNELNEQVVALEKQRAQENSYFKLQRIIEETSTEREKIENHFLKKDSYIDFINEIESLAPVMGLALDTKSLESPDPKKEGDKKWLIITLELEGTRNNIEDYLKLLESLPYVSRLTDVKMSAQSSSEWVASVAVKIQILSYDTSK